MAYAQGTTVRAEKSEAEIKTMLRKYGADEFISGWSDRKREAMIRFRSNERYVLFRLPMPSPDEDVFWKGGKRWGVRNDKTGKWRTAEQAAAAYEGEARRRWRALALVVKAKLEAVETGITSFESEFLAHIVMPDGMTVGDHVVPRISEAYQSGRMPLLLPASVE